MPRRAVTECRPERRNDVIRRFVAGSGHPGWLRAGLRGTLAPSVVTDTTTTVIAGLSRHHLPWALWNSGPNRRPASPSRR